MQSLKGTEKSSQSYSSSPVCIDKEEEEDVYDDDFNEEVAEGNVISQ